MTKKFLIVASVAMFLIACNSQQQLSSNSNQAEPLSVKKLDYRDSSLNSSLRAKNLVQQMTIDEKLGQVLCYWQDKSKFRQADGFLNVDSARVYLANGIGQIGRPSDWNARESSGGRDARNMAEYTNQIQKFLVEETRLGIPTIFHEECLHGHAAKDGTSFPQPIAFASSWNRELVEDLFAMTAKEARVRGTHLALTPVVDVVRDPRWGRTEETYGEDPYLAGEIGLAAVRGFQGRTGKIDGDHVMATLKHMTGHGQPEGGTNIGPANISERTIREMFLPPFEKCIREGHAQAVMASYNEIDGVPSHASKWLIQDILRGEWDFDGVVVSDYFAIEELHKRHSVAKDLAEAGKIALETGIDIELPDPKSYPLLKAQIESGMLDSRLLDQAVERVLKQKIDLGLFENPYVDPDIAEENVATKENAALALKAAKESIILLQNKNNFAPISLGEYQNIAVIGPNADKELIGGYSDQPKYITTFLEGLRETCPYSNITYAEGCGITEPGSWYGDEVTRTNEDIDRKKILEAVEIAKKADLVVMVLGGNELTSREAWAEGHLGDRTSLELVGMQNELIDAVSETGKPIISFLFNGRPLEIQNVLDKSETVFQCWYLGQEGGLATASTLIGNNNPSAKLTISMPRSSGHIPCFYNYKPTARRGYLFDDVSPLFPFGYGLSYTNFSYGIPSLSAARIVTDGLAIISVDVTNAGDYDGAEIVQLYIRDVVSSVTRPVKELKDFEKVFLKKGETKTVSFEITEEDLWMWDINMERLVEPGEFKLMIGSSSKNDDLQMLSLVVE